MNDKNTLAETKTEQTDPAFTISELAKEFDLTTRAIRFYEAEGLITPLRSGKQRVYSLRDHTRLKLIIRGKRLGFSLFEIREMFELYDSEPGEAAQLHLILDKVSERKMQLEQQLEDIKLTMHEMTAFENQCKKRLHEMEKWLIATDSPCIKVCELDRATKLCRGCLRYLDEIAKWTQLSEPQKNKIIQLKEKRITLITNA